MRYAAALTAALAACAGGDFVTGTTFLTGTYTATAFQVTPSGASTIDVRAAGGSLSITIRADGTTTGSLHLPSSVTGEAALTASMEGTAIITGLTVRFEQTADTFIRNLVWSRIEETLVVIAQSVGEASWTITLSRLQNF